MRNPLFDFLRIWSPTQVGLPQRVLGSSLLANAFIDSLDEVLQDYRAIRWMDDIVIFCDSRREGISAILRLQEAMQALGLFPNAQKTFLVPFDQAESLVEFIRFRRIEYALTINDDSGTTGLASAWNEAMRKPELAERTKFSFCVSRFVEQDWKDPLQEILSNLERLPHVSDHASRYLRTYLDDRDVLRHVTTFLKSRSNQFVWQEYRLATLYWHAPELTKTELDFVRQRLKRQNTYWASRTVYARALARHGTKHDAVAFGDLAEGETNQEVLRALIIAAAESRHVTKTALRRMGRDDPELMVLVDYLRSRDLRVPAFSF